MSVKSFRDGSQWPAILAVHQKKKHCILNLICIQSSCDFNGRMVVVLGLWIAGLYHITDGAD